LRLSKKRLEHGKNWRAHLKRESAPCNRSFAPLVLSRPIQPRVASDAITGAF
jgi:hypothetical protein